MRTKQQTVLRLARLPGCLHALCCDAFSAPIWSPQQSHLLSFYCNFAPSPYHVRRHESSDLPPLSPPPLAAAMPASSTTATSACRVLREHGGELRVAQRGAQAGDTLVIDFAVRNAKSQEVLPGLQRDRHELECDDVDNFLPGVMPKMWGMQVGEQRMFDFQFPDKWQPADFAGVKAQVTIKLREVLEWQLPELTLEIARAVSPDTESVEAFHQTLKEAVIAEASSELQVRLCALIACACALRLDLVGTAPGLGHVQVGILATPCAVAVSQNRRVGHRVEQY
jgi:hypothetical protein